jgi:hypothetical protein
MSPTSDINILFVSPQTATHHSRSPRGQEGREQSDPISLGRTSPSGHCKMMRENLYLELVTLKVQK